MIKAEVKRKQNKQKRGEMALFSSTGSDKVGLFLPPGLCCNKQPFKVKLGAAGALQYE